MQNSKNATYHKLFTYLKRLIQTASSTELFLARLITINDTCRHTVAWKASPETACPQRGNIPMINNAFQSKLKSLTVFSLPVLLAVAGCDGTTLSGLESDLANGEDVNINLSTNDDGNVVISTGDPSNDGPANDDGNAGIDSAAGGVFVMSNILDRNTIVGYSRASDGTLSRTGEFATGGNGGDFDGAEGLDPLISAYSLINTPDNEYLMAVNAGSNTISVMRINDNMTLDLVDTESTAGIGPNSLAYNNGIVYVTNIDADGEFNGEPDQEGSIYGYTFENGDLTPINGSLRELNNRPAAVRFSPNGEYLLVTSINAGSAALASNDQDEIVIFGIDENGVATDYALDGATSTLRGNAEGRNLPSAIGFEVVDRSNGTFAIVTEAREFRSEGEPPVFPGLQTGSVSVFQIGEEGSLTPSQLDLLAGQTATVGQRTACWIVLSPDGEYFWVSNAVDASISTYRFTDSSGNVELIDEVAAIGVQPTSTDPAVAFDTTDGWIDLDISDDGNYIYQLFGLSGAVGVYEVDGGSLTLVETVTGDLPDENTQGIIAF